MTHFAAVDCGTNSTRLLIANEQGERVVEELRITRLGEGVHANRSLLPAAIDRTCDALREFKILMARHEVVSARAVSTSAVRDASNSAEFLRRATDSIGVEVEVIAGAEEAALTYEGATSALERDRWHLVIDIGGGSTELVLGRHSDVAFAHSFDLGCVRLTEQFLAGDPPSVREFAAAAASIEAAIGNSALPDLSEKNRPDLIAVAGTATSLAALDLGLDEFESDKVHGHVMTFDAIENLHESLSRQTAAERTSNVMPKGRAEVILGGTIVLVSAMRILGLEQCRISTSDLLTGLVFTQLRKQDDR